MTARKVGLILVVAVLIPALSLASWQDDVESYLGPIPFYADLVVRLERSFATVKDGDKGAVALVLAYCYDRMHPGRRVGDLVRDLFSRAGAEENPKVSYWLKRCFEEFADRDLELAFLSPRREGVRKAILDFRDRSLKEFPTVRIRGKEVRARGDKITLKLDLYAAAPCGWDILDRSGATVARGTLSRGKNRIIAVPAGAPDGGPRGVVDMVFYNKYFNPVEITYTLPKGDPGRLTNAAEPAVKAPGRKWLRPGVVAGGAFLLVHGLVLRPLAADTALAPQDRANLHASGAAVAPLAWGGLFKVLLEGPLSKKAAPLSPAVRRKTTLGLSFAPFNHYRYLAYTPAGTTGAGIVGRGFSGGDVTLSVTFKEHYRLDLFYGSLKGGGIFIEGGYWDTRSRLVGVSPLRVVGIASPRGGWLLDFFAGPFLALAYHRDYRFIEGNEDPRVGEGGKVSYGLSGGFRLGVRCFKKFYLTVEGKYFYPINDFGFSADPFNAYRLRRRALSLGLLLPVF